MVAWVAHSEGIWRSTWFCQEIFHSSSTWRGAIVMRCHETGDIFKEASVRRQLSRIIPKLGESIDWHGMPSRTMGTETLLCEQDVRNFKNSCLFRIVCMPWQRLHVYWTVWGKVSQLQRPNRKTWNLDLKEVFLIRKGNEVAQVPIFQGTPFISPISVVRLWGQLDG